MIPNHMFLKDYYATYATLSSPNDKFNKGNETNGTEINTKVNLNPIQTFTLYDN